MCFYLSLSFRQLLLYLPFSWSVAPHQPLLQVIHDVIQRVFLRHFLLSFHILQNYRFPSIITALHLIGEFASSDYALCLFPYTNLVCRNRKLFLHFSFGASSDCWIVSAPFACCRSYASSIGVPHLHRLLISLSLSLFFSRRTINSGVI